MSSTFRLSESEINAMSAMLKQAGEAVLEIYNRVDNGCEYKKDGSPITLADTLSNKYICEFLEKSFSFPIISEENKELDYTVRCQYKYVWLVDPLDGTKEFVNKRDEFTLNVALVLNGEPIFGMIYVPVYQELFYAQKGEGCFFVKADDREKLFSTSKVAQKGNKLEALSNDKIVLALSKSHQKSIQQSDFFESSENIHFQTIEMGSSLKFCRLAQGKIDVYIRNAPTMEWDTAAGQIIAAEAGKKVLTLESFEPLIYNKSNLLNPFFIAF
jgi:3'(2'), 5'-bisphosphate nucleotidase